MAVPMTNYADYAYYNGTYKGAVVDAASFDLYARKSTQMIRTYTLGNIVETNIQDEVKMCCCELAEALFKADNEDTKGIASEKVGEYSVTYTSAEVKEKQLSKSTSSIIYKWLAMTGLLYRGCN